MHSRLLRSLYKRSSALRRFVPIRKPILLKLKNFKIYVRLNDWSVGLRIALQRNYEAHVSSIMQQRLQPGMVVVDVGANIGFYTLLAAAQVGEKGRVIAFEPAFANCELLQMSLAANNFHNVALHNVAVADLDGVVGYIMGSSNGSINRHDPYALPFQVPAVRLDTLLGHEPRIDLLKMDIEGAEGLALAGMEQLLSRHKPIIFTEFSPRALQVRSGLAPEEYLDRLRALGYDLHVLHREGGQHATPQNNAEIMHDYAVYQSDHLDLVAYPR